jgi:uncharacterized protein with FMN-binding domain
MAQRTSGRIVALGSAAVTAIYMTGYLATAGASASLDATPVVTALRPTAAVVEAAATPTPLATATARAALGGTAPSDPTVGRTGAPADGRQGLGGRRGREDERRGRAGRGDVAPPSSSAPSGALAPPTATPQPAPGTQSGARAPAPSPTAQTGTQAGYKDGTYTGSGDSRRGGFEVAVTIQGGRIANVALTRVWTQYPASRIAALPGQVVARQSTAVDRVSGATYSVQAFRQAVDAALAKAAA